MDFPWRRVALLGLGIAGLNGCAGNFSTTAQASSSANIDVGHYSSFDTALSACPLTGLCVLSVPLGNFATSHYGQNCISRSNTAIVGSGQPNYDDPSAPTKLVGGTVIQPGLAFCGASEIAVSDLGIDDGPAYVEAGGVVTDGLSYDGANNPNPTDPLWINNSAARVTSLGSSNLASAHAFRFEHGMGVSFDALMATYDTHCIAIKAQRVTGGSVATQACSSDQVVIKSDSYTAVSNVDISKIDIKSLSRDDSQNGVVIDSEATTAAHTTSLVHIGSIQAVGEYSALTFLANGNVGDGAVNNVRIDSLTSIGTFIGPAPDCLLSASETAQTFQYITISNVQCINNTGAGGFTSMRMYAPMFNTQINNWTTLGQMNPGYLNGVIQINGWDNGGGGASAPAFSLGGGTATNISIVGYTNTVPGSSLYTSDGLGEIIKVSP